MGQVAQEDKHADRHERPASREQALADRKAKIEAHRKEVLAKAAGFPVQERAKKQGAAA